MTNQIVLNQTTNVLPISGTNEVQLLTISGTPMAGGVNFLWNGRLSLIPATWSATNATLLANINASLAALLGAGSVVATADSLTLGIGTIYLTFGGTYACNPQYNGTSGLLVAVNNLTGTTPTAAITLSTAGVQASFRGAASGGALVFVNGGAADEVQTLTIGGSPTTGHFTISGGTAQNPNQILTTGNITWSSTNSTLNTNIQNALNTKFGTGNVTSAVGTMTSGVGTITLTFTGTNANAAMNNVFTAQQGTFDGTLAIAQTTPGGTNATLPPLSYKNVSIAPFQPSWEIAPQTGLTVLSGDGAVTYPGRWDLTKGSAAAITIAAPVAGVDDGKEFYIISNSAEAHVITCSTDGFNAKGSSGTITFAGDIGDSVLLQARNGHLYVISNINGTVA